MNNTGFKANNGKDICVGQYAILKQREDWMTNRDVTKRPKKFKTWCPRCDRYYLKNGEKCPVCGFSYNTGLKKDTNA